MKTVILGSAGQLGRALSETAPSGAQLTLLDRSAVDLSDAAAVESRLAQLQPELIINAAAYTAVDKAESDREAAYAVNRDAVGAMAAVAARSNARLVHVSTDFVFDGAAGRPYRPDDATNPLGVYGASKLEGEKLALGAPGALVVRTAWVYAPAGKNFVHTMLRLMNERPSLGVVSDQIGTPTSAVSLARALWELDAKRASGLHHFTDAGVASWYDFAVAIQEEGAALGLCPSNVQVRPILTADYPTPARRPTFGVLDKSSTWAALDQPPPHWRAALRDALAVIKEQNK